MATKRRKKATRRAAGTPKKRQKATESDGKGREKHAPGPHLIDMAEAIRMLGTTRPTFYRWLRSGKIKGMKVGRQWRFYRVDIERFLKGEGPRIDLPADIGPLIQTLRQRVEELGEKDRSPEECTDVQRAVSLMIVLGVAMRASDIHITSHLDEGGTENVTVLRYRLDGVLHQIATIDIRLLPAIVEQWKRMAACDVREKERPQDGRIMIKLSEAAGARDRGLIDMRVSFLPAGVGESVTVRILDRQAAALKLDRIDYTPRDREKILQAVHAPWGLILVTGPTGSGKTTVLYSCLMELARPEIKAMSVEDPVEYYLPWVTQVPVRESAGVTFDRAVRAMLRSDPDVILIGEIRNYETLAAAVQSALTGHLVLTTLHAEEAARGLARMVDMGLDPFVVADSTKLVMSQRLVRKLCAHCRAEDRPDSSRLDLAADAARKGGLEWHSLKPDWRKAVGCGKCSQTGYRARTVVAETLEVTPEIGKALRAGASVDELRSIAVGQGMTTLAADGIRRAAAGETTLDDVLRVIG